MNIFLEHNKDILHYSNHVFHYDAKTNSIVVMEKLEETITNENRKYIIDKNNARYRANILKLVDIINATNGKHMLSYIEIAYRIEPTSNHYQVYSIGDIIKSIDDKFNRHTMYYGIPYFLTFERAWHSYLICNETPKIINDNNDYIIETYDSFGKNVIKTFDTNGVEIYSLKDLFDPLIITAEKKINKFITDFLY
jgi:hypothetical protein